MKRRGLLWLVLFLALTAAPAHAFSVNVRSGEHPDFTRITLPIGNATPWELTKTAKGYALAVSGAAITYNLKNAFDRIPRDRLVALSSDPGSSILQLDLGCDCKATAQLSNDGLLIIDIFKGETDERGSTIDQSRGSGNVPQPSLSENLKSSQALLGSYDWELPTVPPSPSVVSSPPQLGQVVDLPRNTQGMSMEVLHDRLVTQMGVAASSGSIKMQTPNLSQSVSTEETALPQIRVGEDIGMLIQDETVDAGAVDATGETCIKDEDLDIGSWAKEEPLFTQLPEVMAKVLGEFDKIDEKSAVSAAKIYIAFGFGAEARRLVRLLEPSHQETVTLSALADIVDNASTNSKIFSNMALCRGNVAFWSTFQHPEAFPLKKVNTDAALLAFSALPSELRRQLGPRFVDILLSLPDLVAARNAWQTLQRSFATDVPLLDLIDAKILIANGEHAQAAVSLKQLERLEAAIEPKYYGPYMKISTLQDMAISETDLTNISALAMQYKGTDLELELHEAEALAVAGAGDFERALEVSKDIPAVQTQIWALVAKRSHDAQFIALAVVEQNKMPVGLPIDVTHEIARRLLDLGFKKAALRWIDSLIVSSAIEDHASRLLNANIALGSQNPSAALKSIEKLLGSEAVEVTGKAMEELGDIDGARSAFQKIGGVSAMRRLSLQKQNWENGGLGLPPAWREAISSLENGTFSTGYGRTTLYSGKSLLEKSEDSRKKLEQLLDNYALDLNR